MRARGAGPGTGPDLGLERRQLGVHLARLGGGVELPLDVVAASQGVGKGPGVEQLVDGPRPGLHVGDLVLGPLQRHAGVGHRLGDAPDGLADAGLGLRRRVAGLQGLLLRAEGVDLGLQARGGGLELLLLGLDLLMLGPEALQLVGQGGPARQRFSGQVLLALGKGLLGLVLQLLGLPLQLRGLELEALLGGGHVGQGPLHLLEVLGLLLVGEVEHVGRVLGLVERLVGLGLHDGGEPLHHAHRCAFLVSVRPRSEHVGVPASRAALGPPGRPERSGRSGLSRRAPDRGRAGRRARGG